MTGLVEFLRARLDEDEQAARGAAGAPWVADVPGMVHVDPAAIAENRHAWGTLGYVAHTDQTPAGEAYQRHIARHDPARVLREVEVKRRIVERYRAMIEDFVHVDETVHEFAQREVLEDVVDLLALPYAEHPDYREEWRP